MSARAGSDTIYSRCVELARARAAEREASAAELLWGRALTRSKAYQPKIFLNSCPISLCV